MAVLVALTPPIKFAPLSMQSSYLYSSHEDASLVLIVELTAKCKEDVCVTSVYIVWHAGWLMYVDPESRVSPSSRQVASKLSQAVRTAIEKNCFTGSHLSWPFQIFQSQVFNGPELLT